MSEQGARRHWVIASLLAVALAWFGPFSRVAHAGEPTLPAEQVLYTIAIGQNQIPISLLEGEPELRPLRYADDDAAQVYTLLNAGSRQAFLLAVLDRETQVRFPDAARAASVPTLAALDQTIATVRAAMEQDRKALREPVVIFFVSGHGVRSPDGGAALALFDGALTQHDLYERVLAKLPARYVHLIIDACHAGAVVRSRDVNATLEPLSESDITSYLEQSSLARFPHVGAVLASTASTQSFEWDAYRGGVFAHELLSGLRGAADVNADGRIEYSELAAFFSAANLDVQDPAARLRVVVQPPRTNGRAVLIEHGRASHEFRLTGRSAASWTRPFFIETETGSRLLDMHPEKGSRWSLWLPAGVRLYLVSGDAEFEIYAAPGAEVQLASLTARKSRPRPRGAAENALRRGLFRTSFGPAFYRGFTSERDDLVSVQMPPDDPEAADIRKTAAAHDEGGSSSPNVRKSLGYGLLAGGGVSALVAGVFTGAALNARADYENTEYERPAAAAETRFSHYRTAAWVSGAAALALAGTGLALILWPEQRKSGPASPRAEMLVTPEGCFLRGAF